MELEKRITDLEERVRRGEIGEYTPYAQQLVERLKSLETKVDTLEQSATEKRAVKLDRKVWTGLLLAIGIPLFNFIERNFNIVGK